MIILYLLFSIILFVILTLLIVKISIILDIEKLNSSGMKVLLKINLFKGIISIDPSKIVKKPKKQKASKKGKKEDKSDETSIMDKISKVYEIVKKIKYTYYLSKDQLRKILTVKELNLDLEFGLDDAAETGIATGIIWGVVYNLFSRISSFAEIENHTFNIVPNFNAKGYRVKYSSIISFRLVNIICIAFMLLINYLRVNQMYKKAL